MTKAKKVKKPLTKVYAIYLDGQGDRYETIIDKECWKWLISDTPARAEGKSSWNEFDLAPKRVQDAVRKSGEGEYIDITSGSTENDRAMILCSEEGVALFTSYTGERGEAKEWAKDHNAKIVDYFEGGIY